jgi:uncharacterized protein (TIGR01777 family)
MRIGITGMTGLIGRRVAELARRRGHEVIGFTRHPEGRGPGWRRFDLDKPPDVTGCDAILNLAGESVVGLWTPSKRRRILESRVVGARRIVDAIFGARKAGGPGVPQVLVNGSAIGFYGNRGETALEETAEPGHGFLAEVCQAWEREALRARGSGARVALLRTGMVLAADGGALAAMLPVFRLGLGARLGSGRQWIAWIHIEDEARLALAALENAGIEGPVNLTAPNPVRNADFTRHLAAAVSRPALFAVPSFALRMVLDGFADELLESRRVLPAAVVKAGFVFQFPSLPEAFANLLGKA